MKYTIIQSELIEWMKAYEGEKFHAILSDPPYALLSIAKRFGPGQAPAKAGADGRHERLSRGFMGQTWDGFDSLEDYQSWVAEWAKLMIEKVLYPGALCLFFGGTRTWHHLAVGLENGGFEIYDSLMWLYGSGFPKSHDISKKTDGSAWDGYGTALKPSWEPIIMCRAPRKGQTFASLATEFGSGALNIDGGRIGYESGGDLASNPSKRDKIAGGKGGHVIATEIERRYMTPNQEGRWPANLLLSHTEDCQLLGDIIVEGKVINRWKEGMKPFGDAAGEPFESEQFPPETIERWACVAECPVRQLDDQVGIRTSGSGSIVRRETGKGYQGSTFGVESRPAGTETPTYGDSGFVSRFFYCGKASRKEKDAGLETFFWKRVDAGYERISESEWLKLAKNKRAKLNIHPTVKPLELLQYLATLVLPPELEDRERRIFIPFSGSGSEIIGSLKAGWDIAVGVEAERQYNEIAIARISHNLGMFGAKVDF